MPGVKIYGPADSDQRTAVVSLTIDGMEPASISDYLASKHNIATRSGYHCAPLAHETIGTLPGEGTTRFSFGFSNTRRGSRHDVVGIEPDVRRSEGVGLE